MVKVLSPPLQAETEVGFGSTSQGSPSSAFALPRSHGQVASTQMACASLRSTGESKSPASNTSSAPSSPRHLHNDISSPGSFLSTPPSVLSLDEDYCEDAEEATPKFPRYQELNSRPSHAVLSNHYVRGRFTNSRNDQVIYNENSSNPPAPLEVIYQSVGDDTVLTREPSRHVDYLSHDWQEEDIWCSWSHIVARRNQLENSQRLENAVWRTWAKCRSCLKTVSPEKLNWMKDNDVTWLYGPLQTPDPQNLYHDPTASKVNVSRTDSFLSKKPILKKHSMSEIMLRRSLSNSTLVRQAVDALATQGRGHVESHIRSVYRVEPEIVLGILPTPHKHTQDGSNSISSSSLTTSGTQTPSIEKHIHFNNKVEQCIAIDEHTDDMDDNEELVFEDDIESVSSDDGIIMMRTETGNARVLDSINSTPRGSFSSDTNSSKTIAMLPSTTLKYRGDTPEPIETNGLGKDNPWSSAARLSHSNSLETLRPKEPTSNFLIDEDDEESELTRYSSMKANSQPVSFTRGSSSRNDEIGEDEEMHNRGLRRTSSGMFMPYEIDDDPESGGLFDRVLDTVNTARDIAHVIWNVGWRR